jgi:hypothetical protein
VRAPADGSRPDHVLVEGEFRVKWAFDFVERYFYRPTV